MIPRRDDLLAEEERHEADLHAIRAQIELLDRVDALEEELANATLRGEANEQNLNDALAEIETLKTAARVAGERIRELETETATLRTERDVALDQQHDLAVQVEQLRINAKPYASAKK